MDHAVLGITAAVLERLRNDALEDTGGLPKDLHLHGGHL